MGRHGHGACASVEPAAWVLGWLGDLDLIDYQRAEAIIRSAVLPVEYPTPWARTAAAGTRMFAAHFLDGWN